MSSIELAKLRFQSFHDIPLFMQIIGKLRNPHNTNFNVHKFHIVLIRTFVIWCMRKLTIVKIKEAKFQVTYLIDITI